MHETIQNVFSKISTFLKPHNLKTFLETNKEYVSPVAIGLGFIIDNLTLTRIDQTFDNIILLVYVVVTIVSLLLLHSHETKLYKKLNLAKHHTWIFAVMMFGFGGLFSGFIVFYSRSASLLNGWPFILILLGLMIGGEMYKKHYQSLTLQIIVLYIALFAYFIFVVPVLFSSLGVGMFLLSSLFSLIAIAGVLFALHRIDKKLIKRQFQMLVSIILGTFLIFQFLYFTNIIPPIPLSLKFANVYEQVTRVSGDYQLTYQKTPWFNILRKRSHTLHVNTPEIYIFSAVFAPTDIHTTLFHQWYYKGANGWERTDRIPLTIAGGRDGGFRGFSKKTNLAEGTWRVLITTDRDQELGRVKFKMQDSEKNPRTKTEVQ